MMKVFGLILLLACKAAADHAVFYLGCYPQTTGTGHPAINSSGEASVVGVTSLGDYIYEKCASYTAEKGYRLFAITDTKTCLTGAGATGSVPSLGLAPKGESCSAGKGNWMHGGEGYMALYQLPGTEESLEPACTTEGDVLVFPECKECGAKCATAVEGCSGAFSCDLEGVCGEAVQFHCVYKDYEYSTSWDDSESIFNLSFCLSYGLFLPASIVAALLCLCRKRKRRSKIALVNAADGNPFSVDPGLDGFTSVRNPLNQIYDTSGGQLTFQYGRDRVEYTRRISRPKCAPNHLGHVL